MKKSMVNTDFTKASNPKCYFCGDEIVPHYQTESNKVLVQASDETPEEAQMRYVCPLCDPKK